MDKAIHSVGKKLPLESSRFAEETKPVCHRHYQMQARAELFISGNKR